MSASSRYSAHLGLEPIGTAGQQGILDARVGLVGLGGLGCAVAQYLVSSGVGSLTLFDFDTVSESNLARQFLYRPEDVGLRKTEVAKSRLAADNPQVALEIHDVRVDQEYLEAQLLSLDLLLDASDNYGTRQAVNRACLSARVPWVMGAAIRMEGQLALFKPGGACYSCVYREAAQMLEDCPGAGIFASVAGIVGVSMAHLALMHLAGLDSGTGLHVFDGRSNQWQRLALTRNPHCPECADT
ncbi:MAG: HesA/MoeB/ThiF family protein [Xanthomonadales bacterium]|nr:HesA/MoeB/ThiF family protein [Gammaproteobacteria bacterium]NNE04438.1 HesA/MoeB/ThiF family protein [Xanthomonadales bacterium]NNL94073.1 HesA/MoeB/ThiF family protein [Xanthomonadales bacterium]